MPKLYLIKLTAPNPPTIGYTVYYNSVNPSTIATIGTTTNPATNLTKAQLIGAGLKVTVPDSATSVILYSPECTSSTTFSVPPSVTVTMSVPVVGGSSLTLSWNTTPSGVAISYLVFKNGILIATLGEVFTYNVIGLSVSTNYNFSVQAKASGNRVAGVSNNVNVTTNSTSSDTTPPSIPLNLVSTTYSPTEVSLTWSVSTDNVGVSGYTIYRSNIGQYSDFSILNNTSTNNYFDATVQPNTSYWYKITAYDEAGNNSGFSEVVDEYTFG